MAVQYDFTPKPLTAERTFAIQLERECFQENLALIVRHADLIMEYREFAELRLSCVGYSFCWYKGEHIYLGELLNYYKHGMAIVRNGCPHCGGDVYNRWSCGSMLSGVRSNAGTCIKCGKYHESTQGEFGSPKYRLPYELPEKHVSKEYQKVQWNIFYLVQMLKMLKPSSSAIQIKETTLESFS